MEIKTNVRSTLTNNDIKILQSISIALRGFGFLVDNGKEVMENYLFIDCGEKLNPNTILNQCYHQYSSLTGGVLESFASKIDNICFPNGIDENSSIFDELINGKKEKQEIISKKNISKNSKNYYRKHPCKSDKKYSEYNKTLYRFGDLSMNPRKEPLLRGDT